MKKILIVDDNKDYVELISEFLSGEGYAVSTACNGREAIATLEQVGEFDLIITDVLMPDIDGIGLINYIKSAGKDVPVIALSGGGLTINSEDVLKTIEDRVNVVLQKPVSLANLVSRVDELTAIRA